MSTESKLQAEALLVTSTADQIECLSEVIRNLLTLPVAKSTKLLLAKHKSVLTKIADSESSIKQRRVLIQSSAKRLITVLQSAKIRLLKVL